ncbi:hypothetical protein F4553_000332 [Allocatelliglobosispora scoriae]|uniref:Secreted protein n=1 Tax=Allocatelliglobosispora scoriae TaxID=643052 RepID=A0A841BIR8_9ACTN|nr:hypothetical protein [Allocatelliglobosispora scoriae]MBB5866953.1 hypothetical protein [Allocatelliglobosispora scoriae]
MFHGGRTRRRAARLLAVLVAAVPLAVLPASAQAHNTCGQPTNVAIATSPQRGTLWLGGPPLVVPTNTTLMFTAGSVHAGTPVRWGLYDPVTQKRFFHTTQPSQNNCVVLQEPEAVSAATIGVGTYEAWAIYIRWESNTPHAETSTLIGTVVINQA